MRHDIRRGSDIIFPFFSVHSCNWPPPLFVPLVMEYWPSFDLPANVAWVPGKPFHSLSETVRSHGERIMLSGHDCGFVIPHWPFWICSIDLILQTCFSSRSVITDASSKIIEGVPVAVCQPSPAACCADPISLPLVWIFNTNNHVVDVSALDTLKSLGMFMAMEIGTAVVMHVVGKGLGKLKTKAASTELGRAIGSKVDEVTTKISEKIGGKVKRLEGAYGRAADKIGDEIIEKQRKELGGKLLDDANIERRFQEAEKAAAKGERGAMLAETSRTMNEAIEKSADDIETKGAKQLGERKAAREASDLTIKADELATARLRTAKSEAANEVEELSNKVKRLGEEKRATEDALEKGEDLKRLKQAERDSKATAAAASRDTRGARLADSEESVTRETSFLEKQRGEAQSKADEIKKVEVETESKLKSVQERKGNAEFWNKQAADQESEISRLESELAAEKKKGGIWRKSAQQEQLEKDLEAARKKLGSIKGFQADAQSGLKSAQKELDDFNRGVKDRLGATDKDLAAQREAALATVEDSDRQIQDLKDRQAADRQLLEDRVASAGKTKQEAEQALGRATDEVDNLTSQRDKLATEIEDLKGKLGTGTEKLKQVEADLAAQGARLKAAKEARIELEEKFKKNLGAEANGVTNAGKDAKAEGDQAFDDYMSGHAGATEMDAEQGRLDKLATEDADGFAAKSDLYSPMGEEELESLSGFTMLKDLDQEAMGAWEKKAKGISDELMGQALSDAAKRGEGTLTEEAMTQVKAEIRARLKTEFREMLEREIEAKVKLRIMRAMSRDAWQDSIKRGLLEFAKSAPEHLWDTYQANQGQDDKDAIYGNQPTVEYGSNAAPATAAAASSKAAGPMAASDDGPGNHDGSLQPSRAVSLYKPGPANVFADNAIYGVAPPPKPPPGPAARSDAMRSSYRSRIPNPSTDDPAFRQRMQSGYRQGLSMRDEPPFGPNVRIAASPESVGAVTASYAAGLGGLGPAPALGPAL